MLGGNPNTPNNPFAPRQSWMSKQANGSQNPYGFGLERMAGKLALQRNVPGMPTNTVPLPAHGGGMLPADWHQRAQTNAPMPTAFLNIAQLGLTRDPATNSYLQNGQPIDQTEWYRLYNDAIQRGHQPPGVVANGPRTGAVADAYAAQSQPQLPVRRQRPTLGSY